VVDQRPHRRGEGLADRTIEQMRSRLRDFADGVPEDPRKIQRRHVERWMDRPELSPSYRHGRLSTVRGFALWLAANGHTAKDFTLGVKPPRVVLGVPKRLQAH
jgi:site-specific recombinase XerD